MRLTLAALAAVLILAAPAHAAGPELGIADDRILLAGGPLADEAVAEWADMGIEQVRILALWSRIAPNHAEGAYDWTSLDHAVDRVVAAGMEPMLNVTGPGPLWVSRRSERGEPRYDPDPALYGEFARAVAERYGDRVDRYILWNEPNLAGWLMPQASCVGKRCSSVAPHLYRSLVRGAYPLVHDADPGAEVLIGALAPRGDELSRENANHRPLAFLRAFGCVDARFKQLTTGRCRGFKPATADGFAFHPHGVLTSPETPFPNPDDVALASLSRLTSTLDRLQRGGRMKATTRRFNLFIDEFGYQTNPPDKLAGVSPTQQDQWLQRAAYLAWRNPRVKLFSQYLWRDEPRGLNPRTAAGSRACGSPTAAPSRRSSTSSRRSRSTPRAAGCGVRSAGATPSASRWSGGCPAAPVADGGHAGHRLARLLELEHPTGSRRVVRYRRPRPRARR